MMTLEWLIETGVTLPLEGLRYTSPLPINAEQVFGMMEVVIVYVHELMMYIVLVFPTHHVKFEGNTCTEVGIQLVLHVLVYAVAPVLPSQ